MVSKIIILIQINENIMILKKFMKNCVTYNLSFLFLKLILILIIYKIYIYNITDSINEP